VNNLLNKLFLLLLIINCLYVLSGAIHFPMSHIDVWSDWLYKAKGLYLSQDITAFLVSNQHDFSHPQYPILLPLLFSYVYTLLGEVNELAVSLFSPLMYIVSVWLCYSFLQKMNFKNTQSLLFTYIYSMLPPLLAQGGRYHAGMADIYILVLHWIALHLVHTGFIDKKVTINQISALVLIAIIGSLIKVEGLFLIVYILFLPIPMLQKCIAMFVGSSGFIFWQSVVKTLSIKQSYGISGNNFWLIPERLPVILLESLQELFLNLKNWYILWWLFLGMLVFIPNKSEFSRKVLTPLLVIFALLFLGIYLFSTTRAIGYVSSSLDRLLLQISPLWIILLFQNIQTVLERSTLFKDMQKLLRRYLFKC